MLKKLCLILIAIGTALMSLSASAKQASRRELPSFFYNSYIGLNTGYGKFNFTNTQLIPGFTADKIDNEQGAARIYIGHYVTPYLAIQVSLMRPFRWVQYSGIQAPPGQLSTSAQHTIWISLFGIPTIKPTWRINHKWWLYGETGLGLISRHGFKRGAFAEDTLMLLPGGEFLTPIYGGGISYHISQYFFLDANVIYTPPTHVQPYIFYGAFGFYYYIFSNTSSASRQDSNNSFIFPLDFIQFNYFDDRFFNWEVNKYFTPPYLPIFWDGDIKTWEGVSLMYERNFFHTDRTFSIDWGASVSRWVSRYQRNQYYAFSLFPAFRFWLIRSKYADFYFTYSVAGPTILTRRIIDHQNTGEHFTFQDFLGFGFFLGKNKRFNMNAKIMHYSNGNMFEHNPGIAIPLMLAAGYTF